MVVANMGAMAARLTKDEVVIVSGGTDSHIVLEAAPERAGLTCNKNGISFDAAAPASPWQNGLAERPIGSIRRECSDRIIVLGEEHLRRILKNYAAYYNALERIGHSTSMRLSLVWFSDPTS